MKGQNFLEGSPSSPASTCNKPEKHWALTREEVLNKAKTAGTIQSTTKAEKILPRAQKLQVER